MTAASEGRTTRSLDSSGLKEIGASEEGYALPSILMLVTILSLVAFSVLSLEYLERKSAMLDVGRIKAEYAAQSGVLCIATELDLGARCDSAREFIFYDGSRASVRVIDWGALYLVTSTGYSGEIQSIRRATLADRPGEAFSLALALGNSSHQLVFTGSSSITGDVAVGPGGVSTGQLHGYSTPTVVPIQGHVTSMAAQSFPHVDFNRIHFIGNYYRNLLQNRSHGSVRETPGTVSLRSISDSLGSIDLPPGAVLSDSIARPDEPLYIYGRGNVTIGPLSKLAGMITIASSDSILIANGAVVSGCVFVAMKGIRAVGALLTSTQLISPRVVLGPGCWAAYPSIALSIQLDPAESASQTLWISQGANFEGFVGLVSPRGDDALEIDQGSHVKGAVFSSSRLTLDGDLVGAALAADLFFYEAPTSYFGWMRSGSINRVSLPKGLLIAPTFEGKHAHSILEWL